MIKIKSKKSSTFSHHFHSLNVPDFQEGAGLVSCGQRLFGFIYFHQRPTDGTSEYKRPPRQRKDKGVEITHKTLVFSHPSSEYDGYIRGTRGLRK